MTLVPVSSDMALFVTQSGPPGRTLLAIHGGPDWDHSYLRSPLDSLDLRVVLPDLRGCGRSGRAAVYTPDLAVSDLLSLLDVLGVAQADVLGFSYGGLLAQRLALAAPTRVRSLIVASSSILPVPPGSVEMSAAEAAVWSDSTLDGAERTRAAAFAGAPTNVWQALPAYLRLLEEVRFSDEWLKRRRAGLLPPARPVDAAERLAALDIPILQLHGRHDVVFPAAVVEAAPFPTVMLEEAGHIAHVDQPDEWLAAVRDFLGCDVRLSTRPSA